ncbi:MAG: hypothetical protein IBX57_00070 [Gammaproteobacteria bacterium]|nr:hypothetical protein [Gammaproteobacteria bacterium]
MNKDNLNISFEAMALSELRETTSDVHEVYVILTNIDNLNDNKGFVFGTDPYTHISVAFEDFDKLGPNNALFTYKVGSGVSLDKLEELEGAPYSLYKVLVDSDTKQKIKCRLEELEKLSEEPSNELLKTFSSYLDNELGSCKEVSELLASNFISKIFTESGVPLVKDSSNATIKPYSFVKSKLLHFVRRGFIKLTNE